MRGTTDKGGLLHTVQIISIHVPLAGDDLIKSGGDTMPDISIHVPLAGDDILLNKAVRDVDISIHVPLAGDDRCIGLLTLSGRGISIHVPLAGDDWLAVCSMPCIC